MQARRRGSIINIASMLAQVAAPGVAPYAAAKAAIMQLSRVLALEMAPYGVRVNSIAPGYIDTPLTRQHAPEVRARITETTPLRRFGEVTELMGPVLFLASDASSFVTGSTLVVDGGWTAQ
jgi:NAD(P)-dependent dehydrogenase (short-subunit alcohol dehydrogenase family)